MAGPARQPQPRPRLNLQSPSSVLGMLCLVTLVVGDGAVVRAPLQTLAAERGLAWVERDVDGAVRAP